MKYRLFVPKLHFFKIENFEVIKKCGKIFTKYLLHDPILHQMYSARHR